MPNHRGCIEGFSLTCINHDTIRSATTKGLASAVLGTPRESLHMQLARSRETNQPNCCGEGEFSRILDELCSVYCSPTRGGMRGQVVPVAQVRTNGNRRGPPCGQRRVARVDKQHSIHGSKNPVICHFFDLSGDYRDALCHR